MSASEKTNEIIPLFNRDRIKTELRHIEGDWYLLYSDIDMMQVTYNHDDTIYAVDPAGGPYLSLGSVFDDKVITEIKHDKKLKGFVLCLTTKK